MKLSRKERREGNKRKEAGKSGRKERGRRGGGREESVPLNSCRVLFLPCRLSPALELKRGSFWHQRLSLWFLFPAPAGTQTSLKWVFGFWDTASLLKSLGLQGLLTWSSFHRLSGKLSE